jgi:hypothetical protein
MARFSIAASAWKPQFELTTPFTRKLAAVCLEIEEAKEREACQAREREEQASATNSSHGQTIAVMNS